MNLPWFALTNHPRFTWFPRTQRRFSAGLGPRVVSAYTESNAPLLMESKRSNVFMIKRTRNPCWFHNNGGCSKSNVECVYEHTDSDMRKPRHLQHPCVGFHTRGFCHFDNLCRCDHSYELTAVEWKHHFDMEFPGIGYLDAPCDVREPNDSAAPAKLNRTLTMTDFSCLPIPDFPCLPIRNISRTPLFSFMPTMNPEDDEEGAVSFMPTMNPDAVPFIPAMNPDAAPFIPSTIV